MKQIYKIPEQFDDMMYKLQALSVYPDKHYVEIKDETRTLAQNSQQWPILEAFAQHAKWRVDGEYQYITAEDWKDILTAGFRNDQTMRVADGFEVGKVILGQRTRQFSKKEWPEWMAYLNWAAAEKGVKIPVAKYVQESYDE